MKRGREGEGGEEMGGRKAVKSLAQKTASQVHNKVTST